MSELGRKIVNASPKIPPEHKQAFIDGLNGISDRLGICRDWLYIIMMTESAGQGTINPDALNSFGCGGLIQFCPGQGAKTVGKSGSEISRMSALAQLPLVEKYLRSVGVNRGGDLPTTYLSILTPAKKNAGPNDPLNIRGQAHILYKDHKQNSLMTKATLEAGLLYHAKIKDSTGKLKETIQCSEPVSTGGAVTSQIALPGQIGTPGGLLSDFMIGECEPWDYTVASAKVYTGCEIYGVNTGNTGAGTNTSPTGGGVPTGGQTEQGGPIATPPPGEGNWMNPSPGLVLTSGFGLRSVRGGSRNHQGIDLSGAMKAPILASKSGVISAINTSCPPAGGYPGNPCGGKGGNWIRVNHEGGWQTRYLHLYDVMVKVGDVVKQGQQIGTMGNSGSSTGKHLHFEIRINGTALNPLPLISPKPGGR